MSKTELEVEIRRLRKKLRQIENLETLNRDLIEEELKKLKKKDSIRTSLRSLLAQCPAVYEETPDHQDISLDQSQLSEYSNENVSHDSGEPNSFLSAEDEPEQSERLEPEGGSECAPQAVTLEVSSSQSDKMAETQPPNKRDLDESSVEAESQTGGKSPAKKPKVENVAAAVPIDPRRQTKELQKLWKQSTFSVTEFEGHSDLVTAVCLHSDVLVSGSRDTTVKIWDTKTGSEVRSLGGHTESVTQVIILGQSESSKVGKPHGLRPDDSLVISTSLDCTIRLWSLKHGEQLKSIYTYNPITVATYMYKESLLVIGLSGGKVELWDMATGSCVNSLRSHEDEVTGLAVGKERFYSSSADGVVKVLQLRDRVIHVMFESDGVKTASGERYCARRIRCLAAHNERLYFGDDGTNVKVMDWKAGVVHKLPNHLSEFGTTDAVCCSGGVLVASGYDLDNGLAFLNVRLLPEERYLCTVTDEQTSRVLCVCLPHATANNDTTWRKGHDLRIVTGGFELKMWTYTQTSRPEADDTSNVHVIGRYDKAARHSDVESGSDVSDARPEEESDSESEGGGDVMKGKHNAPTPQEQSSWRSWCAIL